MATIHFRLGSPKNDFFTRRPFWQFSPGLAPRSGVGGAPGPHRSPPLDGGVEGAGGKVRERGLPSVWAACLGGVSGRPAGAATSMCCSVRQSMILVSRRVAQVVLNEFSRWTAVDLGKSVWGADATRWRGEKDGESVEAELLRDGGVR